MGGMPRKSAENNDEDIEQDNRATYIASSEGNDDHEEFHGAVGKSNATFVKVGTSFIPEDQ